MTDLSRTVERLFLYLMILLAVAAWMGVGGLVFFGILRNVSA